MKHIGISTKLFDSICFKQVTDVLNGKRFFYDINLSMN